MRTTHALTTGRSRASLARSLELLIEHAERPRTAYARTHPEALTLALKEASRWLHVDD
jgi:hypothetical protein